jgi:hypothetical protein
MRQTVTIILELFLDVLVMFVLHREGPVFEEG